MSHSLEIVESAKEVPVYIVGGQEFFDRDEAEAHAARIDVYEYFVVGHSPDLTEGRGFQRWTVVAAPKNEAVPAGVAVQAYARATFGPAVVESYGPTDGWHVQAEPMGLEGAHQFIARRNRDRRSGYGIGTATEAIVYIDSYGQETKA